MTSDTTLSSHDAEAGENSPAGALVQRPPAISELARQLSLGTGHEDPVWQAVSDVLPDSIRISGYALGWPGRSQPGSAFPGAALRYERALLGITAHPTTGEDVATGSLFIQANPLDTIQLRAQAVTVDFGGIPTVVEEAAQGVLNHLPVKAVSRILSAIREWLARTEDVERARLIAVKDPEEAEWTETVLELRVDTDTAEALRLWEDVAACVDAAKLELTQPEREAISRYFGLHLVWQEDDEED